MFRTKYSKLTEAQIGKKLAETRGPIALKRVFTNANGGRVPESTAVLAGSALKIVADKDFKISYKFADLTEKAYANPGSAELTFSLNDGKEMTVYYEALEVRDVVLFTHLIPGTQTTLNVIWNRQTNLVTVFEIWFCGENAKEPRETSREIYQGYAVMPGADAPEARHKVTNRLENKAIVWTDDDRKRILNIFNATMYCSFVELDDPKGGIPIAAPADYIRINDELYIYSRVEAEFSGTAILEVIDLFALKRIGVRFGFNEKDELDYYVYYGSGELAGQLATFSKFTDYGGSYDMNALSTAVLPDGKSKKGMRGIYRVHGEYPDFTEEEAKNSGKTPHTFPKGGQMMMPTGNSLPDSDYLVGKSFTLRDDDGFAVQYQFSSINEMKWKFENEKEWHEESYKAFETGEKLFYFAHIKTGADFGQAMFSAIDFTNGLATTIEARQGNGRAWREVGYKVHFGVMEEKSGVEPPAYLRHGFTTDLVGKAFTWNYSGGDDGITSMHVYSSPWGYSWTIFLPNGEGGMLWSSPCSYIKLREDCYIMNWVEETSAGGLGSVLMNLRTMHDGGFMYGAHGPDKQVGLSSLGAYGRLAGKLDIMKYYDIKVK